MPRLLCSPCWDRDRRRPAENVADVRAYGSTPMCADCADEAGQAQIERDLAAWHGGSSWGDSAQIARARRDGAMR